MWRAASTTCWTATVPGRRSSSTSRTIATSTRWTRRSCRRRRSGSAWRCASSGASRERDRTLDYLKDTVRTIWKVIKGAESLARRRFPALRTGKHPLLPNELRFLHAEDILDMYPDLPRKQRETLLVQRYPAVFIIGIGWPLKDGFPLEMAGQLDNLRLPYHQAILRGEIPLSIGSGIGQSRTQMLLLRKAHLGEVSVTVWPRILKEMGAKRNIHVLE